MWRRTYLFLILIRLYFALSASYLHPDEHFQGPEVIAGRVFKYPVHQTWEFTSSTPIRSVFPLWLAYGLPMYTLRLLWEGVGQDEVAPIVVYWALRILMFMLSFVLEDWAIQELVEQPRQRHMALLLVASSYATWTYQTHTFSNSIETLVVLWCVVLIRRIVEDKKHTGLFASFVLGFLMTLGTFNRITFPAFVLLPALSLIPHFLRKPLSLVTIIIATVTTASIAIISDTSFYRNTDLAKLTLREVIQSPVIPPLNSLRYNSNASNLAHHGLHPRTNHIFVNLPLLLGPATLPLLSTFTKTLRRYLRRLRSATPPITPISPSTTGPRPPSPLTPTQPPPSPFTTPLPLPLASTALVAIAILSLFPHQEPRFLLPAVPLLLTCVRVPRLRRPARSFTLAWVLFNALLGTLMGTYHQGGVVRVQGWLAHNLQLNQKLGAATIALPPPAAQIAVDPPMNVTVREIIWWKTYSPPLWILNGANGVVETVDMMGAERAVVLDRLKVGTRKACYPTERSGLSEAVFLVAPKAVRLLGPGDQSYGVVGEKNFGRGRGLRVRMEHLDTRHVGMDDLDWGTDGVIGTLWNLVSERGLVVWSIWRDCGG
ncbi:hypothetical protein P152DRAFT_323477 [Eremomyces bilateralis CBS 781.70]|uniref:Mannosyltransferase n=1 Tax=Eremomyces bilateralis CBS 781.70 TaxID=1392243 RepID=A0A6G1G6I0_9PEZI|nr:uncharacterized protein P152DRAFT_323477 [Eremomyces bilateralis CBS 781.70]KAF1813536.1 hypothetical protein P152DRAFT_323477 [Eremomyces bilateralis CBS 781.70]